MRKPTRNEIWRHNGLLGGVARARILMNTIQTLPTTTYKTKMHAEELEQHMIALAYSLRTRTDQEEDH